MSSIPPRSLATRAAIYADAVSEEEAAAHQNIADDLADLVSASLCNWRSVPGGFIQAAPDLVLLFAGLADVLSDALEGISSGHLQAIYAARDKPQ